MINVVRRSALTLAMLLALTPALLSRPAPARALDIPHTDITRSDTTPVPGKLAEPSDDVQHPGSTTEWWYSHIIDPATGRTFIAMLFTAPVPVGVIFWYPQSGQKVVLPQLVGKVTVSAGPAVTSNGGNLVYDATRGAYHLTWNTAQAKADVWFDHALPGVTGGPINYDNGQTMYWTAPVATSHVTGWLQPPGSDTRIDVTGWRGYHDHNWGHFNVASQSYDGWEWGVSHEPDGTATLLGGVVKGDGTWQGVIGRVTPQATYGCMATLKLSDWQVSGLFSYPKYTEASCPTSELATPGGLTGSMPGLDETFQVDDPFILDSGLIGLPESLGSTGPGSLGLIEHIRTLKSRL